MGEVGKLRPFGLAVNTSTDPDLCSYPFDAIGLNNIANGTWKKIHLDWMTKTGAGTLST